MPAQINKRKRGVLYAKDIESITGRKPTAVRKLLFDLRKQFNKKSKDFITVREFCLFTGIDEDTVHEFIRD